MSPGSTEALLLVAYAVSLFAACVFLTLLVQSLLGYWANFKTSWRYRLHRRRRRRKAKVDASAEREAR